MLGSCVFIVIGATGLSALPASADGRREIPSAPPGVHGAAPVGTGRSTAAGGPTGRVPSLACDELKLTASDATSGDRFGNSVAISGSVVVVGASEDDDLGNRAGSAYAFRDNGADWVQESKLTASDATAAARFGTSVAISGEMALVGALYGDGLSTRTGAAYVYRYDGTDWIDDGKLIAGDGEMLDLFGASVAILGTVALVGAPDEGGGNPTGSAYVFRNDGVSWVEEAKLIASDAAADDRFGVSVSLSGDVALIGAVYDDDGGTDSGAAYVFQYDGTSWVEVAKLTASDAAAAASFGVSVALSPELALVGAHWDGGAAQTGAAYLFRYNGATWSEEAKLVAPDAAPGDWFGVRVALSDAVAVVGVVFDDDGGMDSGSAYVFRDDGSNWVAESKLTAGDADPGDMYGIAVAVSGDHVAVGAVNDFGSSLLTGAAYLYRLPWSCVTSGLLRNDDIRTLSPVAPAIATLLPLDPVLDLHHPTFRSGSLDWDSWVLDDDFRPLVLYAIEGVPELRVVKAPGRRIQFFY